MADRSSYPSEQADKFLLRLPDGMRDRLKVAADENKRSMNSEIVARLEESLVRPQGTDSVATLANSIFDVMTTARKNGKKLTITFEETDLTGEEANAGIHNGDSDD